MRIGIDYGLDHLDVEVPEAALVGQWRQASAVPLSDPAEAVRTALERPLGFPALRRALTPDDHVAIVVDEKLPHIAQLLTPILQHITEAHIAPEGITLLCPPSASRQEWVDELPDEFQEVRVEVHDPGQRRNLSYLATTRSGRRVYLNRTAVDADQLVVLTGRGYDPLLGYSGAEGALYPSLSDDATRQESLACLSLAAPGKLTWPLRKEAVEVAWLLGAPFFVQVIQGKNDEVLHVLGGLGDTAEEGQRLLDARWRLVVERSVDVVVAGVGGDPREHDFDDLARALTSAARVVRPGGRIVLITRAQPRLGAGAALLRQADDPNRALELLRHQKPADMAAAFQWASAAQRASIFLLSRLPDETAEELFTTPFGQAQQVQRLIDGAGRCLVLFDAHRTMAVLGNDPSLV